MLPLLACAGHSAQPSSRVARPRQPFFSASPLFTTPKPHGSCHIKRSVLRRMRVQEVSRPPAPLRLHRGAEPLGASGPHRYFVALEKQLVEEFGEDLEITSTADPGTTGNFEVTLDGKVRDSAAQRRCLSAALPERQARPERSRAGGAAGALQDDDGARALHHGGGGAEAHRPDPGGHRLQIIPALPRARLSRSLPLSLSAKLSRQAPLLRR